MKRILVLLFLVIVFSETKAQFPGTDSLRAYNTIWITNNASRAFTNYRLHTLLAGMIDWIDSARAGEGGTIGVDSIGVLNDSTFRYRKNGVFQSIVIKGGAVQHDVTLTGTGLSGSHLKVDTTVLKTVADAQRVTDSLVALISLKLNISDTAAMMQPLYDYIASDSLHIYTATDPDPDTLYSYKNGDSTLVGYIPKGVGSQTLQEVLDTGDSTNRMIIYHDDGDTAATHTLVDSRIIPGNYLSTYGTYLGQSTGTSGLFNKGFGYYYGVNPTSGRPNVVYSILSYNQPAGAGGQTIAGEAAFGLRAETHFETGGQLFEFHLPEITVSNGYIYRPWSWYINKTLRNAVMVSQATSWTYQYLNDGTAQDTVLVSHGAAGHVLGMIQDGTLQLINRRVPANNFSISIGNNGVGFSSGASLTNNSFAFNAPLNVSHNLNQSSLVLNPGASSSQPVISVNQGTYTGNRYALDAQASTTGYTGARFYNTSTNSSAFTQLELRSAGGYSDIFYNASGTNYWLMRFRSNSSLDSAMVMYYGGTGFKYFFKKEGRFCINEDPGVSSANLHVTANDAVTNTVSVVTSFNHITSGTAAAGFGTRSEYRLENASGTNRVAASLDVVYTDATNATEDADIVFNTIRAGSTNTEGLRLLSTGAVRFNNAFTFPSTDGTNGQVPTTDGSGNVTWQTPATGITSINSQFQTNQSIGSGNSFMSVGSSGGAHTLTVLSAKIDSAINRLVSDSLQSGNEPRLSVVTADPTDWNITAGIFTILPDLNGAGGNKVVTFPSAATYAGKRIYVWNSNADANTWSYNAAWTDPDGTTSTTSDNGTFATFISTGSVWLRMNVH